MARFLFINQFYWPDLASTGQHLTDLAEYLAAAGHGVEVVCSQGRYLGGQSHAAAHECRGGVNIRRVRACSRGKRSLPGRMLDYLSFHLLAGWAALTRPADVIVTLTTPPLLSWWGMLRNKLRGTPHVAYVMDLHPDAEFAAGLLRRTSWSGRSLEALHRLTLQQARRCVVVGRCQRRRLLDKGVARRQVEWIPVWSDRRELPARPRGGGGGAHRRRWRAGDRFVVLYSGNIGLAHRFDEILTAASSLQQRGEDVLFVFVGEGPRKAQIMRSAAANELRNVHFESYVPRAQLGELLASADAHLVSLREEFRGIAVPGKLYGALASGRPVIFVGPEHTESALGVRQSRSGFVVPIGDAEGLTEILLRLRRDQGLWQRCARRGRQFFEAHHDRKVCCEQWRVLLDQVVTGDAPSPVAEPVEPAAALVETATRET